MIYEKKNFNDGDILTAAHMRDIETALEDASVDLDAKVDYVPVISDQELDEIISSMTTS